MAAAVMQIRSSRQETISQSCFFQAGGGIRALYVTGVQTCALPIFTGSRAEVAAHLGRPAVGPAEIDRVDVHVRGEVCRDLGAATRDDVDHAAGQVARRKRFCERSEERRVGKERVVRLSLELLVMML